MRRGIDITGRRFGRLVVIEKDMSATDKRNSYWRCRCDCGREKSVTAGNLNGGNVRSCGCLRMELSVERIKAEAARNVRHGEAGSKLYAVWHCMIQRCENPNNPAYNYYGGKGIKVCEDWKDYARFARWAYEHGYIDKKDIPRSQRLSIDRIDSNGDYCPENCRWITVHENTIRATKKRWENAKRPKGSTGTNSAV